MRSKNIKQPHKPRLKIGYLLDDTLDKTDGVQQYVLAVGEYMRSLGHEVHYLVAETSRTDLNNVHQLTCFVSLKFNGNSVRTPLPAKTRELKRIIRELNLDVVHVQMPFSPFFAGKFIKLLPASTRVVGTWHTFPAGRMQLLSHHLLSLLIHRAMKRVEVTIGVSKPTAEFADNAYGTQSIVVPNAVNLRVFAHASSVKDSLKKRIVYLGRFDERKGPKYLILAIARAVELGLDTSSLEVVMGGKGPDLLMCIELAKQEGLSDLITFPGFIDETDKPALLASADICVFPSTGGEAFGISVVEAMASGESIVIGGDNAGYRSILGARPELIFNPLDTINFATKLMMYLSKSDNELGTIRHWLRNEAKQYDTSVVCGVLEELYYH